MGHGDYLLAKLLFPITMLSTLLTGPITDPFLAFGVLQFPLYGMMLGFANQAGHLRGAAWTLSGIHAALACLTLVAVNDF